MASDDSDFDEPGSSAMHAALGVKRPRSPRSDMSKSEPDSDSESEDTVSVPSDDKETIEKRRKRALQVWDALKDEIMGTPATWGINAKTKKPRMRQPNRTAAEKQATRAEYEDHRYEMKSEFKHDHETEFTTSSFTTWCAMKGRFNTCLCAMPGRPHSMTILSNTWVDACRADAAAVACANAHNSWKAQRMQKKQRLTANATKRIVDLAKTGETSALERRELLRLRDHVHRVMGRRMRIVICPDGCLADALFRTDAMPAGQWLMWQHKSTAKVRSTSKSRSFWHFQQVLGYTDALVVCSVEAEPDRVWVLRGKVLHDHGKRHMVISNLKEGILPVPADGITLPTNLDGLVAALQRECAKVVKGDATALCTFTVEEAEAMLGNTHAVERAGVLAWMRCMHGGVVPWLEMPKAMRNDNRNLRLLRDGTVVAYPEGQHTEVDLEVLENMSWADLNCAKTKYQFKTPVQRRGGLQHYINLEIRVGHDAAGKNIRSIAYKAGENDVYVAVIPDEKSKLAREGHVDIWEIPEAKLLDLGLLGTDDAPPSADTGGFYIHRASSTANAHTHGWTREYHAPYVHTDYGWLPGEHEIEAELNYEIQLYQAESKAREAEGKYVAPASLLDSDVEDE